MSRRQIPPLGCKPFLLPSGPLWTENFTDAEPPPSHVWYWGGAWLVTWHDSFQAESTIFGPGEVWPDGAYVLTVDKYTSRPLCATLNWRCEIDGRPWHTGDPQPQNGHWPVSIAIFDKRRGDGQDWVAARFYGEI